MIESYPVYSKRNYLVQDDRPEQNVNALLPIGRAIDNGMLRNLLHTAKNDPHVSRLLPEGFDIETHSPGHVRVTAPFDDDRLTLLYAHPGDPYVRDRIGEAGPGLYTYTMNGGWISGFEEAKPRDKQRPRR